MHIPRSKGGYWRKSKALITLELKVEPLTSTCAAGPAVRENGTSYCNVYRGISASEGSWCPWEQLRQEEGWQGLERGKQRCWNGHHCSSLGQEGGSALLDSLGTHRAMGEHAGPPQPARKETSQ